MLGCFTASAGARSIWAVNAGGGAHRSVDGVVYNGDPEETAGTVSDHGVHHVPLLARVHPQDRILYQTERYHDETFGYTVKMGKNGNYVLVIKFSEVYFQTPNQKVFDVRLNKQPVIVGLDIFSKVGFGTAHDEYVAFRVLDNHLYIGDYKVAFDGQLQIDFVKTQFDNPKVNAIVLYEGKIEDVPKLPPLATEEDEEEDIFQEDMIQEDPNAMNEEHAHMIDQQRRSQQKKVSRPKKANPYDEQSSQYWPILISIGVFLPTVILLYTRQKAG